MTNVDGKDLTWFAPCPGSCCPSPCPCQDCDGDSPAEWEVVPQGFADGTWPGACTDCDEDLNDTPYIAGCNDPPECRWRYDGSLPCGYFYIHVEVGWVELEQLYRANVIFDYGNFSTIFSKTYETKPTCAQLIDEQLSLFSDTAARCDTTNAYVLLTAL